MKSRFTFVKAQAYAVISIFLVISQQVGMKVSVSIRQLPFRLNSLNAKKKINS